MANDDFPDIDSIDPDAVVAGQYQATRDAAAPAAADAPAPSANPAPPGAPDRTGHRRAIAGMVAAVAVLVVVVAGYLLFHGAKHATAAPPQQAAQIAAIAAAAAKAPQQPAVHAGATPAPAPASTRTAPPSHVPPAMPAQDLGTGTARATAPIAPAVATSAPRAMTVPASSAGQPRPATSATASTTDAELEAQLKVATRELAKAQAALADNTPKVIYKTRVVYRRAPTYTVRAVLTNGVVLAAPDGKTKILGVGQAVQ